MAMFSSNHLFASSALVLALAVSGPALADTPLKSVNASTLESGNWAGGADVVLTKGVTYTLGITWDSITGAYSKSNFGALVYQGADFVYNVFNIGSATGGAAGASTSFSVSTTGTYQLWLAAYAAPSGGPGSGASAYTVNNLTGSVALVSVPGPIAGAGLVPAVLLLTGFGLYRARRAALAA